MYDFTGVKFSERRIYEMNCNWSLTLITISRVTTCRASTPR